MQTVQGLPRPQSVLHEAGRPAEEVPLVWDLRGIQEPVFTCRHFPRELRDDALLKLQRLPGFLRDLKRELSRGSIALFDCLGSLPTQFPSDLLAMQHVRATSFTGPSVPASTHTGPARLTGIVDVAGRGNRPRIGPVRQHPPGLRITVLRGQHSQSVDCTFDNGAIDALVFDLLVRHNELAALSPSFSVVLGGAQPLRMGYYQEVVFVVQEGTQTASVWDGRHLGQELRVNLHPTGQSTCQVLSDTWTSTGWRLFVNGVPEAAAMRHVRMGDYLQPCSGVLCPGVVPLGSLLALCPMLRPYAWPLAVTFSATGFSANLRMRRKQLGSHRMSEGTARVFGPHHGEVFLQIGTGHTPTALQVNTVLQHLDGFPDGLSVLGTPARHPHDADFVTRYRFRQDSTVLTPAPGHTGHLLVLLVHPTQSQVSRPILASCSIRKGGFDTVMFFNRFRSRTLFLVKNLRRSPLLRIPPAPRLQNQWGREARAWHVFLYSAPREDRSSLIELLSPVLRSTSMASVLDRAASPPLRGDAS